MLTCYSWAGAYQGELEERCPLLLQEMLPSEVTLQKGTLSSARLPLCAHLLTLPMFAQHPRTHALANSLCQGHCHLLPTCWTPVHSSTPRVTALSSRKPSLRAPSRAQLPGLGSSSRNSSFQPSADPTGVGESVFAFAPQPGGLLRVETS